MSLRVSVVKDDVTAVSADVLLLKHAQAHYGADEAVALRLVQHGVCSESETSPADGEFRLVSTDGAIPAKQALILGTPPLRDFRYREMRLFARRSIKLLAQQSLPVRILATTVHGAGYGLDVVEALNSMILGFQQGLTSHHLPALEQLLFVERNARRFEIIQQALEDVELVRPSGSPTNSPNSLSPRMEPIRMQSVFVAMPFTEEFEDIYQFGIYSAVRKCGYVCEKVDESVFAGSIVDRITDGIRNAAFVVADLTLERPNVYLEVGYAWGLNLPVILVAKEGQRLHFDLSHHKCIFYRTIGKLAESLEKTIRDMFGLEIVMDPTLATDLHPALIDSLAADRDAFNARFALRIRGGARIDSPAFKSHLRDTVNPLIGAVHAVLPERVRGVVAALYDVSLDLFAASLLGPEAKLPFFERLWREVLPAAVILLAREPQRVAGALNNAIYQIASQSGTRPIEWLDRMADLSANCDSVDQLLDVGKILAWQSGMVQYRSAALQTVRQIPHPLALRALRLPASTSPQQLAALLDRLALDPWLRSEANAGSLAVHPVLTVVAAVGSFRGFGGPFLRPPTIRCHDQRWFVSDGTTDWQMLADSYGTMFQRLGAATPAKGGKRSRTSRADNDAAIDQEGTVRWGDHSVRIPHLANPISFACDGMTIGVTIATSHQVYLISRNGNGP